MYDPFLPDIPLPSGWSKNVKSAILHAISLAHYAVVAARGWAANSINARVRLTAGNNQLKHETQLLREELRIKDVRLAKIHPRRRPYCPPAERMAILELKSARGWSQNRWISFASTLFKTDSLRRISRLDRLDDGVHELPRVDQAWVVEAGRGQVFADLLQ